MTRERGCCVLRKILSLDLYDDGTNYDSYKGGVMNVVVRRPIRIRTPIICCRVPHEFVPIKIFLTKSL